MGDVGRGFYARPGIPEFFRDHVVTAADIMTPNLFELQYLVGHETGTLSQVVEAARELRERGPQIVVVTSVVASDVPDGLLRMLAVDAIATSPDQVISPLPCSSRTGCVPRTSAKPSE